LCDPSLSVEISSPGADPWDERMLLLHSYGHWNNELEEKMLALLNLHKRSEHVALMI